MKILMIHNEYAAPSGEETEFFGIVNVLRDHGHNIRTYTRTSVELGRIKLGLARAFFAGIYNPFSAKYIKTLVRSFKPDAAITQNLFPLISPSILPSLRDANVPVLMRVSNYRLICPNGLHLRGGTVCERCRNGREYWCFLLNCEGNLFKSLGYALRGYTSRSLGLFKKNVSAYFCSSHFLRGRLIEAGFDPSKIHIIPNLMPDKEEFKAADSHNGDEYVGYAGRISEEKGARVLFDAAAACPDIPFRIAGRVRHSFRLSNPLPHNVRMVGFLQGYELDDFYRCARLLVNPSICFETFGISVAEAMLHGKPIIVSRIGVFRELVQEGVTGLLSVPGDADDLSDKIRYLWAHRDICKRIGRAGKEKVMSEYSSGLFYKKLMTVLEQLIEIQG